MAKDKILIVEDEELILWSLVSYLSKDGYVVETAKSCKEAKSKFNHFCPDAVLLDLRLPDG